MPCDVAELERGAICLALYPYTTGVPLNQVIREVEDEFLARLTEHESIESIAKAIDKDGPADIVVTAKLRRVLVLQGGTQASRQDVIVARVNSVTDNKKAKAANWYRKLQHGIHPLHFMIGSRPEHGTAEKEAYVDLTHLSPIQKSTILKRVGQLDEAEMREVSDRLLHSLEIDISSQIREAEETARRAMLREQASE